MAFRDVNPQAPVHFLVIPKNRDGLTQLTKAREDQKPLLGHLMYVAQMLGQKECPGGFRITINDGKDGAQSVYHLHLHCHGRTSNGVATRLIVNLTEREISVMKKIGSHNVVGRFCQ
jgi:diadenosine tetraphosphate (Ap4A) HIT family hydrolase